MCVQEAEDADTHENLYWTQFPEHVGTCCVPKPGVPVCSEPVHALLFWNMVQVVQAVCNELNADAEVDGRLSASAVLESLQCPHATPQHARSNPVVEQLVVALRARLQPKTR